MPVTVADLLEKSQLGLRLLTGDATVDRPLSWVHVSELSDPAPFLEGGDTGVNEPVHVRGRGFIGPQGETGREQQLPAVQERRRIGQLADVHPRQRTVDRGARGQQAQRQLRVREEIGDGDRHGDSRISGRTQPMPPCHCGHPAPSHAPIRTVPSPDPTAETDC